MTSTGLPIETLDVGGGHFDGVPPIALEPRQWSSLRNMYPFGTKVRRRGGVARLSTAYDEALTSATTLKLHDGTLLTIVGTLTGLTRLDGLTLVKIPVVDGPDYASVVNPWQSVQRNGTLYLARKDTGSLKRCSGSAVMNAGIPAPLTAPVIADGGAGDLAAGDYEIVYTFRNLTTNAESGPSPSSNRLTLGANRRIAVSGLELSSNGQVNAREIYATTPNGIGEYYGAVMVADNTSTTADHNVVQDDLLAALELTANGLPPPALRLLADFRERLFASDGVDVYFSAEGRYESFDPADVIPVFPEDKNEIRALHAHGGRLIVGKTNAIHFLLPAGVGRFAVNTLSDVHGIIAAESMRSAEGLLFWYSGDNVYRALGADVQSISTLPVRKLLDSVDPALKEMAYAEIDPLLGLYMLSLPLAGGGGMVLVYNYKTDAWAFYDHTVPGSVLAPAFITRVSDSDYGQRFLGAGPSGVQLLSLYVPGEQRDARLIGTSDVLQSAIACRGVSGAVSRRGRMIGGRRVALSCPSVAGQTVSLGWLDSKEATLKSRTVSLDRPDEWKEYNLSSLGKLRSQIRLAITYTGTLDFELGGLAMDVRDFQRRGKAL